MRKVAHSFFPEEGVVRDMDIRAGKCYRAGSRHWFGGACRRLLAASQCGASLRGWQQGKPTTASSALARARRHVLHCGTAVACKCPIASHTEPLAQTPRSPPRLSRLPPPPYRRHPSRRCSRRGSATVRTAPGCEHSRCADVLLRRSHNSSESPSSRTRPKHTHSHGRPVDRAAGDRAPSSSSFVLLLYSSSVRRGP